MTVESFLDTNILVYAVDSDSRSRAKRDIARELVRQGNFGVSVQVLQEFYVTVTRKIKVPLSPRIAARWIDRLSRAEVVSVDQLLVKAAIERSIRWQISYWDAAIIAAAEALGAGTVYSEDLNHAQVFGTVTLINPFADVR